MTDKKLKVNSAAYTELSIQIAVLQASVDKLLQLAMKPEKEITINQNIDCAGMDGLDLREIFNPPQWPNESHTDYLKRIGQYNEASVSDTPQSEDEFYGETYK